ncbi:hypothetical protein BC835DRAFT_1321205 [Cytidiella melzeri]|nr:hypothetical protein BC835DRAFT_1321205 [Cytidiella melzeri]
MHMDVPGQHAEGVADQAASGEIGTVESNSTYPSPSPSPQARRGSSLAMRGALALTPSKRFTPYGTSSVSRVTASSSGAYTNASMCGSKTKRTGPRTEQLPRDEDGCKAIAATSEGKHGYKCPHCPDSEKVYRGADYKRHHDTHHSESDTQNDKKQIICCGVPLALVNTTYSGYCGLEGRRVEIYYNMEMVGGCGHVFTRARSKETLRRHLAAQRGGHDCCVGDIDGEWYDDNW